MPSDNQDNQDWGLVRGFDIDDGQLDGLKPTTCFVLGYELAMVDAAIQNGEAISKPIHAENSDRIASYCRKLGREFKITWMSNDVSETWKHLEVFPDAE